MMFNFFSGDGFCDDELNTMVCGYDGNDCCAEDSANYSCTECACLN